MKKKGEENTKKKKVKCILTSKKERKQENGAARVTTGTESTPRYDKDEKMEIWVDSGEGEKEK